MVTELKSENYESEVADSEKPVIIDFWAEWCGPCRMMSPIVDEIAEQSDQYKVMKVNVDEEKDLAMRFEISAIPTIVMVKNGEVTGVSVGYKSKEDLLKDLNADN